MPLSNVWHRLDVRANGGKMPLPHPVKVDALTPILPQHKYGIRSYMGVLLSTGKTSMNSMMPLHLRFVEQA